MYPPRRAAQTVAGKFKEIGGGFLADTNSLLVVISDKRVSKSVQCPIQVPTSNLKRNTWFSSE